MNIQTVPARCISREMSLNKLHNMFKVRITHIYKLVSVFGWVVFGGHHKTSSFPCSPVDGLNNVYHLLFVLHCPVDFVVVTRAQVDHDVLVPVEQHNTNSSLYQKWIYIKTLLRQHSHRWPSGHTDWSWSSEHTRIRETYYLGKCQYCSNSWTTYCQAHRETLQEFQSWGNIAMETYQY